MAIRPDKEAWLIDLAAAFGGDERVVYLRTQLDAPSAREALLEMGSNDGVKVWLNGELLHGFRDGRPLTPNQDQVKLSLNAGANTLMLAIYQHGGDWAACARLRTPDGAPLADVKAGLAP